jgi:general secretion pathway protein G
MGTLPQGSKSNPTQRVFIQYLQSMRQNSREARNGFTLIEIMVVVVILAIMQALRLYRLDNLRYPTSEQGLAALVAPPTSPPVPPNWKAGGYLERLPRDPWGNPYQYLNPGMRGEIDVFSFGADGVAGGQGTDADVGSWGI